MRKLIVFMMTSLDGYYAALDGNIDWHNVDEEFNDFAIEQLKTADMLLFGRVTYEVMASYWPTPMAISDDSAVAGIMNNTPKIVVSRTLAAADWNNTRLIKDNLAEEITKLKQQPGQNLFIFGSSVLSVSLLNLGLIDEVRTMVAPVLLGDGLPVFKGMSHHLKLKLVNSRIFKSGNVLLHHQPS